MRNDHITHSVVSFTHYQMKTKELMNQNLTVLFKNTDGDHMFF